MHDSLHSDAAFHLGVTKGNTANLKPSIFQVCLDVQKKRILQSEFTSQPNTASEPRFNIMSEREPEGFGECFDVPALLLAPGIKAGRNVRTEIELSLLTKHTLALSKKT